MLKGFIITIILGICCLCLRSDAGYVYTGTGFFINNTGTLATAAHVVAGNKKLVIIYKGEQHRASVLIVDKQHDFAILQTDIKNNPYLYIQVHVGNKEQVRVLGFPAGYSPNVVTTFIGKSNIYSIFAGKDEFVVDGKSCHGDSGGPVVNSSNDVVGMLVAGKYLFKTSKEATCSSISIAKYSIYLDNTIATLGLGTGGFLATDPTKAVVLVINFPKKGQ